MTASMLRVTNPTPPGSGSASPTRDAFVRLLQLRGLLRVCALQLGVDLLDMLGGAPGHLHPPLGLVHRAD
jgi:hypothetical protein